MQHAEFGISSADERAGCGEMLYAPPTRGVAHARAAATTSADAFGAVVGAVGALLPAPAHEVGALPGRLLDSRMLSLNARCARGRRSAHGATVSNTGGDDASRAMRDGISGSGSSLCVPGGNATAAMRI